MELETIPIMTSFNNNFVHPARISLYSLLMNASKKFKYKIYTLHSDIVDTNKKELEKVIDLFPNASIQFIDMNNKFNDVWPDKNIPFGFTKEVIYKINAASLFPNLEKLIITDVDVVYLGDLSTSFFEDLDKFYYAGIRPVGKILNYYEEYKDKFSSKEIERASNIGGGFLVANLKEIRAHNHEKTMVDFLIKNVHRLIQLEQDIINICSYGKLKHLPLEYMVCSYVYDLYRYESDLKDDRTYSEEELKNALSNPIHLHYAGRNKPWKGSCTKDEIWKTYEKHLNNTISSNSTYIEKIENKNLLALKGPQPPLVTISIPSYKGLEYLKTCSLASVLMQTYKNFEVFIVNDGEDLDVKEMIEKLNDSRIKYLDYPKRKFSSDKEAWAVGGAAGHNIVLGLAAGKYIAELDQDDLWAPTFLENKVRFLEDNPNIDFIHSNCIFSSGRLIYGKQYDGSKVVNTIGHLTILYRRELVKHKYAESGSIPGDFLRWQQMYNSDVKMKYLNITDTIYNEKKQTKEQISNLYKALFKRELGILK